MFLFLRWVGFAFVIMFIAWVVPGISVANFLTAMIAAFVLALVNVFAVFCHKNASFLTLHPDCLSGGVMYP